jgi:hypothetical protein
MIRENFAHKVMLFQIASNKRDWAHNVAKPDIKSTTSEMKA